MIAPDVGKKVSKHVKEGPRQHEVFEDNCVVAVFYLMVSCGLILVTFYLFDKIS